jgi:hypothetical protein
MRFSVATRTRKNSSRLFEKIPRNRSRSRRGTEGSAASCSTLALKESQLISRKIVFRLDETIFRELGNKIKKPTLSAALSLKKNFLDDDLHGK